MKKNNHLIILIILLVMNLTGCMTLINLDSSSSDKPVVYGGVRTAFKDLNRESKPDEGFVFAPGGKATSFRGCFNTLTVLDLPLSFALDTVLLPVTIPMAVMSDNSVARQKDELAKMIQAIRTGDTKTVGTILDTQNTITVESKLVGKNTALHLAAKYDQIKVAELLLNKGAYVDENALNTPLSLALNSLPMVEFLINKGAKVNSYNYKGQSYLYQAIVKKDIKLAKLLLELNADPNQKDIRNRTPVLVAILSGQTKMLQLLLEYKGDLSVVRKPGHHGMLPLYNVSKDGLVNQVINLLAL